MILNNTVLFQEFCKNFNARLCSLDFVLKTDQIVAGYDPFSHQVLILPVNDHNVFQQLVEADYTSFLKLISQNLKIEDPCYDVFFSEIDADSLSFFIQVLEKERLNIKFNYDLGSNTISVQTIDLISDLLLTPLGQLHSEVVISYQCFNEYIKAFEGQTSNLFLNANASNCFSEFIQMWVAENLNISLTGPSNVLVK